MSKRRPAIYLASGYGFSKIEREVVIPRIEKTLEEMGWEVWEPFTRNNQPESLPEKGWARVIAERNYWDVVNCDAVFAIVNGVPPDEGVCYELGVAAAHEKPTFLFRDDFRACHDSEEYPLNLMLFAGLPHDWRDHYYTSIGELDDTDKALQQWLLQYYKKQAAE